MFDPFDILSSAFARTSFEYLMSIILSYIMVKMLKNDYKIRKALKSGMSEKQFVKACKDSIDNALKTIYLGIIEIDKDPMLKANPSQAKAKLDIIFEKQIQKLHNSGLVYRYEKADFSKFVESIKDKLLYEKEQVWVAISAKWAGQASPITSLDQHLKDIENAIDDGFDIWLDTDKNLNDQSFKAVAL